MKLITNGCSFTWGAEILPYELNLQYGENKVTENLKYYDNYRISRTYTKHLHDMLKTDSYENLAFGGGSNKRIIRTTLEYFMPKISQGVDVSDHFVVLQWTEPGRNEIYHDGLYYAIFANGSLSSPVNRDVVSSTYDDYIKGRILLDDMNFTNQFMSDIILMSSFLKLHNIKYVFTHIASKIWKFPEMNNGFFDNINWSNHNYKDSSIRKFIDKTERTKNIRLTYPQNHLNPEGHRYFAEILYNRFVELYNL